MTPNTIADTRAAIKTAIQSVAANVYDFVPETPQVPFAAVVPGAPYWEFETISRSTFRAKLNFIISVGVAYFSNPAALGNLEELTKSIVQALPAGYELSVVESPAVTTVGSASILVNDIRLSIRYEQTN
ncbi:MAG: hypothetical protein FGM60_05420 [Candidatus Planktophila sp.]|jgi:hypothetical protein|nr:hypothetical protein [Candidatus Planktophila sp.]